MSQRTRATATTKTNAEDVNFSWTICNWKSTWNFNERNAKPLVSPIFKSSECKWQMEFQRDFETQESSCYYVMRIVLSMLECESTQAPFTVSGYIRLMSNSSCVINHYFSNVLNTSMFVATPFQSTSRCHSTDVEVRCDFTIFNGKNPTSETVNVESSSNIISDDLVVQTDKLREALSCLFVDKTQSDMSVNIKGRRIKGHSAMLAARSPVLKAMIRKATKTLEPLEFEVECESEEAWNEFQQFMYTGQTSSSADIIKFGDEMFKLSKKFEVEAFSDHLTARLRSMLNSETVVEVLELAYRNGLTTLQEEDRDHLKGSSLNKHETESVNFSWTISNWKSIWNFNESNAKPLVSPIFKSSECKWQMEFQRDFGSQNISNDFVMRIVLTLLECESTQAPFTASGYIRLMSNNCDKINSYFSNVLNTSMFVATPFQSTSGCHSTDVEVKCDFTILNEKTPTSEVIKVESSSKNSSDDVNEQTDNLSKAFKSLLIDKTESDMCVIINGHRIKGHSPMLGARSPVLKTMIRKATKKQEPLEFEVECENKDSWNELMQFMYTGQTSSSADIMKLGDEMLKLSKKFEVKYFSDHLTARLRSILSPKTVTEVLELAYRNGLTTVQEEGKILLTKNLSEVRSKKKTELMCLMQQSKEIASILMSR